MSNEKVLAAAAKRKMLRLISEISVFAWISQNSPIEYWLHYAEIVTFYFIPMFK